jgi:hypothetical protein
VPTPFPVLGALMLGVALARLVRGGSREQRRLAVVALPLGGLWLWDPWWVVLGQVPLLVLYVALSSRSPAPAPQAPTRIERLERVFE